MDFGDILNEWENRKNTDAAKRGNSGKNDMETWLDENEVFDKDAYSRTDASFHGNNRRRLLNQKPDDIIDIHGLTLEKALDSLELFFENAKTNGFKKLRIVHGKGNHTQGEAVLKAAVRKFIEQCGFAGESGFEKAAYGGSGATWVLLK